MTGKIFKIFIVLFFMLPASVFAENGGSAKHRFVFAGDEKFPPYEYVEEVGAERIFRGFNVDIMRAIALEMKVEIDLLPMPWAEARDMLEQGRVDAIQGMKYDEARAAKYDYSEPYLTTAHALFVRRDSPAKDMQDLKGKRVATQSGDIASRYIAETYNIEQVSVGSQEEAIALLVAGKVEGAVVNKLAGQYVLYIKGELEQAKLIGADINPAQYAVAVRKGDVETLAVVNRGLQEIKKNGTYQKIYEKWFGKPIEYPQVYYMARLKQALVGLVGLLALAVGLGYINYLLRREVRRRTCKIEMMNQELMKANKYVENENRLKTRLLNSGYSGIVEIDASGHVLYINKYVEEQLGVTLRVGEDYRANPLLQQLLTAENGGLKLEDRGETRFQEMVLSYCIINLADDDVGRGVVLHIRDITEDHKLRQQIVQMDRMEVLGALTAGIAHEIRTPLTSIKNFATLLPAKYDNPVFRDKAQCHVPEEVNRICQLVNQLLDYSQPRSPVPRLISGEEIWATLMFTVENYAYDKQIQFVKTEDKPWVVYADKQQLQQVLLNIMINAIDAVADVAKPVIQFSSHVCEADIVLVIADNGSGMEEETKARAFNPFFTTKGKGTGLGLAVSQQLVRENRGEIWLESEKGKGTKFMIRLPMEGAR